MRQGAILAFALSAAFFISLSAHGQPPPGEKGKGGTGGTGGTGGPGGFGMRGGPGQILPPFLQDRLKLTDEQKKAVADLQKEVETKLDKMLTDEQRAELKKLKETGPGFPGGPGGKGGFPGAKGGFPGDKGGNPPPRRE